MNNKYKLNFKKQLLNENDPESILIDDLLAALEKDGSKDALQLHSEKIFASNLKDRIIWVDLQIKVDDNLLAPTILDIEKQILKWNQEDKGKLIEERTPIKMMIYCYGGELDATLSLIAIMNASKTPIYTYNMGVAYSGAFMLLINGHKRFTLPTSTALFHEGSGQIQGSADEIKSGQNNYERQLKILKENVYSHTKIDAKIMQKNLQKTKDWYFSAEDCLKYGIVDSFIVDIDDLI